MPEMMLHLLALASRASLDFCNWTCFYCHFNYISGQNFKVVDKRDYKEGDLQQFENMRLYWGGDPLDNVLASGFDFFSSYISADVAVLSE